MCGCTNSDTPGPVTTLLHRAAEPAAPGAYTVMPRNDAANGGDPLLPLNSDSVELCGDD